MAAAAGTKADRDDLSSIGVAEKSETIFAARSERSGTPRGTKMARVTHAVLVVTLLTLPVLVERAYAHHGAGLYDMRKNVSSTAS